MIPPGHTICREVTLNECLYVMYLVVEEEGKVVVFTTNCEEFLMGSVTVPEISKVTKKLEFYNLKNLNKLFRNCIQQKKFSYSSQELKLIFSLVYSDRTGDLIIPLKRINGDEKKEYMKSLLCRMAQEITVQEETAAASPSKSIPTSTLSMGTRRKMKTHRVLGMSIINPGTKRICTGSGVKFEEG